MNSGFSKTDWRRSSDHRYAGKRKTPAAAVLLAGDTTKVLAALTGSEPLNRNDGETIVKSEHPTRGAAGQRLGLSRKLRIEYPGAMYPVMNRGDQHEAIFKDDEDRQRILSPLGEACGKTGWQVQAYGLMRQRGETTLSLKWIAQRLPVQGSDRSCHALPLSRKTR